MVTSDLNSVQLQNPIFTSRLVWFLGRKVIGDKGGKKDKEKALKQNSEKQKEKSKTKLEKQATK